MCLQIQPCELLIVEDDRAIIGLLNNPLQRAYLLREGLHCTIAPDLATAVKILSAPDCIQFDGMLIDPHLTDSTDEKATLATLCEAAPDVAPFVYTGGVDDDFYAFAKGLNVEHVFIKGDWDIKHLFIMLHYALGQARARKRLKCERDENKVAKDIAVQRVEEVVDKYNRLVEKNTEDVVESPAVKALEQSIITLRNEVRQLAATH